MSDAKRDANYVPTLLAVSNADGKTPVTLYADPTTHRLLISTSGGTLAGLSDVELTGTAQGDILYHNGTKWVNLAAGTSGKFLKTQGAAANPIWDTATAAAGGSDTQVQFNDGGASLGGDAGFVFNKTSNIATLTGAIQAATANIADSNASHYLVITASSDLTANRVLSLVTGDAARTITLAGNLNIAADLITSGANSLTLTTTGATDVTLPTTGTIATLAGIETFTNKTLTSPAINTGTVGTSLVPTSDDGAALGDTTHNFSDLFLATGAVLNYANGNVVITHTSGILTMGTGDLRITTAGTNAASVVTVGGTQTLTNKTLTSPTIGTSPTAAGATWTDLGTVTTADINGGTIDGVTIGGASAGAITGTTITANTGFMPDANDGAYLGQSGTAFSDLFLASGALIDFAAGNAVVTHSSGILTVSTGELRVTTAGTNAASVPTLGSTSTLTNKTLTAPTINASTMSGIHQLTETGEIRLDAASSADGAYNGITRAGTAGAALAFGDLTYLAAADSRWELADANAASTSGDVMLGMCVLAAAADGDATVILFYGIIRADTAFPALTIGAPAYVGTTAGDIQTAQPTGTDDVIRRVGFAWTADELLFNPSNDYITHT